MSEIKIRAWDGKVMHIKTNELSIHWTKDMQPFVLNNDGEKCIIIQFTGLKDKNGKEIYEGDIVEIKESRAKIDSENDFINVFLNQLDDEWCDDWNLYDDCGRMNVIGNIYENPELLK